MVNTSESVPPVNDSQASQFRSTQDRFLYECDHLIMFCTNFEKTDVEDHTDSLLEVKLEDLENRWRKMQCAYETLMLSPESSNERDFKENARVNFNVCSDAYYVARAHILDLLRISGGRPSHNNPSRQSLPPSFLSNNPYSQIPQTDTSHISLKVPPCDTDIFQGGYEEWPSFRDMFTAVYVNHPKLTRAQKLYHLRNKTKGNAGAIVKRYTLCDENFDLAWNALKSRYENKRVLVDNQLKVLFNIPVASTENSESIQKIQSAVNDCICTLKTLGVSTEGWDPLLIYLISTKLPDETLSLWEQSLKSHRELPKWSQMDEFLINRFEVVERISSIRSTKERNSLPPHSKSNVQTYHSQEKLNTCILCETDHSLRSCPEFRKFSTQERIDFVYKNKFCNNCLGSSHSKANCKSKNTCFTCKKQHHTLLHIKNADSGKNTNTHIEKSSSQSETKPYNQNGAVHKVRDSEASTSKQAQTSQIQANFSSNNDKILLRTALVQIEVRGELFTIRALIDPGSQRTFLSEKIRNRLQIPSKKAQFDVIGIGGKTQTANKECELVVHSRKSHSQFTINAIVLPKVTKRLPSISFKKPQSEELSQLDLADPGFNKAAQIDLILGNDSERFINLEGIKKNICGDTSAYNTIFGWVLSGPMRAETIQSFSTNVVQSQDSLLTDALKQFWEQEEVPVLKQSSADDKFCEEFFTETTSRRSDGRYVVRLPFRSEFPNSVFLGSSRFLALGQYTRMEQSLCKNPELKQEYNSVLNEYLQLNHMEETSCNEIVVDDKYHSFYLPHHAVVRPEHKTTKVRVVFNASRKSKSGFSLNDVLHTGPTLQTDLMSTLLNWRKYKYVFSGDIQKMYRQILIHPQDRQFQRILFQKTKNAPIKDYSLKTVTFGINCAPFLAIRTLLKLASDSEKEYPKASAIIRNETYVDDILSGGFSIEEAKLKQSQLISALQSAGFPHKKVTANDSQLLSHLPEEDIYDSDFLRFHESSATKTLGIRWNALTDNFVYSFLSTQKFPNTTKRLILSTVAQLFDPAGWLAPIIIKAKVFMQRLWLEGLDWDTHISSELANEWNQFINDLSHIGSIDIPRWIQYNPSDVIQIHGFADASKAAYCACVYIRCQSTNVTFSNLFVAKTKVAPIQTVCLPRLELCGAVLLAKLVNYVTTKFDFKVMDTILWTDSSIVLGWLSKPPSSWETYVANRTSQIHSLVPTAKWRHVSTHDNPADLGTRDSRPLDLKNNATWWKGPHWLTNPPLTWPVSNPLSPAKPITEIQTLLVTLEQEDILQRFSSYPKALRVLAYVFRFFHNCRNGAERQNFVDTNLTQSEMKFVKARLMVLTQQQHFPAEYESLSISQIVQDKSSLIPLNPFLDTNKIMRVNGRLSNSSLPYNERYPIILPGNSRLCQLYLLHLHILLGHAECMLMCRMVQTEFHITRLKPRVKSIVRKCKTCVIFKHKPCSQIMAPLPQERCTFTPPFHTTGIDFAGPFELKSSSVRNAPIIKGYVSVFVCFSTKAIHLEACSDLSSTAFEAAFARFVGRRGLPHRVVSDNGRNFVGASRSLLREFTRFLKSASTDIAQKYSVQGFEWSFIPPHAPHMGGLWEAAVKSFKHHFKRIAGAHKFTFEQFSTLLARIEGVLNSRPISALSEYPSDLTALTPGHFIKGSPIMSLPEPPSENVSLINKWLKLKALHHQFAIRWKEDYLKSLHKRYKWQRTTTNLKVGDLVAVIDDLLPPSEWRLGRIERTYIGSDKNVRVAQIKVATGALTRPISKLCYLPLLNSDDTSQT